ncbi:MAG: molybdopterin-dependent oxidoreductase [Dehalobacter sp.]|nr:molybdopterin-dependent oxidoreductase [Dehalobacter sp.]
MSKEKVLKKLKTQHEDEKIFYTTCYQNGCWDAACVLRCHVKDNVLTAVEPETINKGIGREDNIGDEAVRAGMMQTRPCVMSHSWRKEIEAPTRIIYPMKRVGPKGYGGGHLERISWDEALDTIAAKIREVIDLYGPYSIFHKDTFWKRNFFSLAPYLKAGVAAWGDDSCPAQTAAEYHHFGYDIGAMFGEGRDIGTTGYEAPDLLNSNLIVLWGMDPLVSWYGPSSYYMKLAREKGIPIILIDPRYTTSAQVLADQWIPIRPGTDLAMMLAVAYVLYEEDLYDHDYVAQHVEPEGFAKFRNYVMGGEDQQAKSPEWAETICTVPAETIREFARLYARSKPVHLQYQYGPSKRHLGEYSASAAILLQAMTGNTTIPGGCEGGLCLWTPTRIPAPEPDYQKAPEEYVSPVCLNFNKMDEAIILREDYNHGKITETEYRRAIGSPPDSPLPNIQMVISVNNFMNNLHDTNKRIKAMTKLHFSWGFLWHHNQPTVEAMDIVLPAPVYMFESTDDFLLGSNRFMQSPGGMHNYFVYCQKVVNPPGEVRPIAWVYTQLANRLGIGDKYNPLLKDVSWDKWDEAVDDLYRKGYEKWAKDEDGWLAMLGINPLPWEEFLKDPVVRVPIDEPAYAFKGKVEIGENPFAYTPSGKIEFSSKLLETTDCRNTEFGGRMDPIPRWEPSYMDEPSSDSFYHPKTKEYPLSMITAISMFRQQSCNANNPLLRDCYDHAVWMNPADAKTRKIESDDLVWIHNELGELVMPVYITSKMMPGTVAIYHGAWYKPSDVKTETMPHGIDTGGNTNFLIPDVHLPHAVGINIKHGLVEIKKFGKFGGGR